MRAREFLREQAAVLPPEQANPMRYTYVIPGLSASDPYNNYRFGVAMARARSDAGTDGITDNLPAWSTETAFGEHGVVAGMAPNIAQTIDQALAMTKTPGGKELVSTPDSTEPAFVDTQSPIKAFRGYPR
jgi:hypothetical protein